MVCAHNQLRFYSTSRRICFPLRSSISRRAVILTTCQITLHCVTIYVISSFNLASSRDNTYSKREEMAQSQNNLIVISFDQLMNDDSCFDIISFLLFQSLTKRFRQRQVFLNAWNMSIQWREWQFSDNWIIFTDKYQDNAKQGVMKKGIIEMRFINIAYSLFYDFSEVLMLKIRY